MLHTKNQIIRIIIKVWWLVFKTVWSYVWNNSTRQFCSIDTRRSNLWGIKGLKLPIWTFVVLWPLTEKKTIYANGNNWIIWWIFYKCKIKKLKLLYNNFNWWEWKYFSFFFPFFLYLALIRFWSCYFGLSILKFYQINSIDGFEIII